MNTSFEDAALNDLSGATAPRSKGFTVTLIRPNDSDEVSMETINAPELSVAFITARHVFPGARILSVTPMAVPAPPGVTTHNTPVQMDPETPRSPGARFIRGMFRPALFVDECEMYDFGD